MIRALELREAFQNIYEKECEHFKQLLENLSGYAGYPSGVFGGLFLEIDPIMMKIVIPYVEQMRDGRQFQARIVQLEKEQLAKEKRECLAKLEGCQQEDKVAESKLKWTEERLLNVTFDQVWASGDHYHDILDTMQLDPADRLILKEKMSAYYVARLLYGEYKQAEKEGLVYQKGNSLEKFYLAKGIDLCNQDPQYSKYQLFSLSESHSIIANDTPVIHDARFDACFHTKYIPCCLMGLLAQLRTEKIIQDIAVRPNYNLVGYFDPETIVAMEELERGRVFEFDDLKAPLISKLYTKSDYDNLWIVIDGENMTFEEVVQDFKVVDDLIVTQVVHLEYYDDKKNPYIVHIDHEYIFYSEEEYERRLAEPNQKGNARKRYKTFKVDNSRIPFLLSDGRFVLYEVLSGYFEKKELLKEYFEKVLKS